MSGLSRCGRRWYASFEEADKAAELRAAKSGRPWVALPCSVGAHWHLSDHWQESVARPKRYRPDPFPLVVARLVDARDGGQCQGCGRGGRLERHHRRAKASGGSRARSHAQCPCNALSLCRRCHEEAHLSPAEARVHGWIVRQSVGRPGAVSVCRVLAFGELLHDPQWATCDGRWVHSPAETED